MTEENHQIVRSEMSPTLMHKLATDVAGACREIVEATQLVIEKRRYVRVEGWQAIANGFGCTASARDVEKVYDEASGEFLGFRAIGEVKRQADGLVIATSEGFIGCDEPRWFGGTMEVWDKFKRKQVTKTFKPAPEYAARAMAQTRAISRACRAAFAFVVVMINKDLSTTPAEEIDPGSEPYGEEAELIAKQQPADNGQPTSQSAWQDAVCSFGKANGPLRGKRLGDLTTANLRFLFDKFATGDASSLSPPDQAMVIGLKKWAAETGAYAE
jgi:hypothetical protein